MGELILFPVPEPADAPRRSASRCGVRRSAGSYARSGTTPAGHSPTSRAGGRLDAVPSEIEPAARSRAPRCSRRSPGRSASGWSTSPSGSPGGSPRCAGRSAWRRSCTLTAAAASSPRTRATGSAARPAGDVGVGAVDQGRPATASSRSRWLASGSCSPVSSPVDDSRRPGGPSTSDVQPSYAATRPRGGGGLERPDHRGAHRDHPAARRPGELDQPSRRARDRQPLRLRRLVGLLARHAGVQHQRRHHDAGGHQVDQHLARQRPPGAGHLRAAGDRCVHVLQVLDRPLAVQVGVADRRAVPAQVRHPVGNGRVVARHSRVWPAGCGAPTRSRTPPGSRSTSPGSGRPGPWPSGRRSSTTQTPSSSSAETCSPQVQPCRSTSSADGSVALVFTTSRSPGSSHSGSSRAWWWWVRPG